jgi:hypothetical protein
MKKLSPSKIINYTLLIALCVALIVAAISAGQITARQYDSYAAERYGGSFTQLSLIPEQPLTIDALNGIRYSVKSAIQEAGVPATNNGTDDLPPDCSSSHAEAMITKDKKNLTVTCFGVTGNYFYFHPPEIVSGNTFLPDDYDNRVVLLDTATAFRLFGSYDISGLELEISGEAYTVSGVYKPPESPEFVAAYGGIPVIYLPFGSFERVTGISGAELYEILLPNPVAGFGKSIFDKAASGAGEIIEVTGRFSISNLLSILKTTPENLVRNESSSLPPSENAARYAEFTAAGYTAVAVFSATILVIAALAGGITVVVRWRKKTVSSE